MSFINTYVNGCIPPLINTSYVSCCSIENSPFVFKYNFFTSNIFNNFLANTTASPNPGLSSIAIWRVVDSNLNITGVELTYQALINQLAVKPNLNTQLEVLSGTLIANKDTDILGSMSWQIAFANPVPSPGNTLNETRVKQVTANVDSASGIFAPYLNGKIVRVYDDVSGDRVNTIYKP